MGSRLPKLIKVGKSHVWKIGFQGMRIRVPASQTNTYGLIRILIDSTVRFPLHYTAAYFKNNSCYIFISSCVSVFFSLDEGDLLSVTYVHIVQGTVRYLPLI
jgi:hypothetical protein